MREHRLCWGIVLAIEELFWQSTDKYLSLYGGQNIAVKYIRNEIQQIHTLVFFLMGNIGKSKHANKHDPSLFDFFFF